MRVLSAIVVMMFSLAACADEQATAAPSFVEGQHYIVLDNPVRTQDANKIEVTEVFWYGCGHCFKFEPMIQQWQERQAEDVKMIHSPAMWNKLMEVHARAFYAAKALGVLEQVHQPIFNALNIERRKLQNEEELAVLFADAGVDAEKFSKVFNSFGVTSQVKQAGARARSYKISGTPEIVVNGTYRVSASTAGSQAKMLDVVDFLVTKLRAARG